MENILLFFRYDQVELWSIDSSKRLIPLNYLDSNVIPLYFLISGSDLTIGGFAKEQFQKGVGECLGNFWSEVAFSEEKIIRNTSSVSKKNLLSTTIFESILPELSRNYFEGITIEEIIRNKKIIVCIEPFLDENKVSVFFELIQNHLFEIKNLIQINYWELLLNYYIGNRLIDTNNKFNVLASYNGDLYCFLIENFKLKDFKVLDGKGIDPRLNAVSDYCVEKIKSRGSLVDIKLIRNYIRRDVEEILNSLSKGLVEHLFDNHRIGVGKFTLSFNKTVLESRLQNPSDLLFIYQEVVSFRERNNCNTSKIILLTESLNLPVFFDKFESIGVISEPKNFKNDLLQYLILEHNKLSNSVTGPVEKTPIPSPIIKCAKCEKEFPNETLLQDHAKTCGDIKIPPKPQGPPKPPGPPQPGPPKLPGPPKPSGPPRPASPSGSSPVPPKPSGPPRPSSPSGSAPVPPKPSGPPRPSSPSGSVPVPPKPSGPPKSPGAPKPPPSPPNSSKS